MQEFSSISNGSRQCDQAQAGPAAIDTSDDAGAWRFGESISQGRIAETAATRAFRWYHLLRHHRLSQLVRRLLNRARAPTLHNTPGGGSSYLPDRLAIGDQRWLQALLERKLAGRRSPDATETAQSAMAGRFRFLNQPLDLTDPIDWRLSAHGDVDALWRFHLHYNEFLLDLAASHDNRAVPRAWNLVDQWIVGNRCDDRRVFADAWHPFCISRRVPAWMLLWQADAPVGEHADLVARSMAQQVRFLASHLERDLGGNHLLENARCLALAGCFFEGAEADSWLATGRRVLLDELPEQVLPHGEHFERAPMYHVQMLELLLDVRDATRQRDQPLSKACAAAAEQMARFLDEILHPDGEIPLLGDSVLGESPAPRELIRLARPASATCPRDGRQNPVARKLGGYWVWRDQRDFLIFDGGPVGPDHLPAHAHSDLLTIEASLDGRRFIVDSGVTHYRDDEARAYCRSTAAHNVLQIDGREQCDTWSRFRMGYRGHPAPLTTGLWGGFEWARTTHDAYRRISVPVVGRWVACRPGGPWLIVDWAEGRGRRALTSLLHLHPDVTINFASDSEVRVQLGGCVARIIPLTAGVVDVARGCYSSRFGRRIDAPVVRFRVQASLPATCGWQILWHAAEASATISQTPENRPVLMWIGGGEVLRCEPASMRGQSSKL